MLATYPEACDAEQQEPAVTPPEAPMAPKEERAIRAWLAHIGEEDEGSIREVLDRCARDGEARAYYLGRAGETVARFWRVRFADGSTTPLSDITRPRTRAEVLERARATMSDRSEVVDAEPEP